MCSRLSDHTRGSCGSQNRSTAHAVSSRVSSRSERERPVKYPGGEEWTSGLWCSHTDPSNRATLAATCWSVGVHSWLSKCLSRADSNVVAVGRCVWLSRHVLHCQSSPHAILLVVMGPLYGLSILGFGAGTSEWMREWVVVVVAVDVTFVCGTLQNKKSHNCRAFCKQNGAFLVRFRTVH